MALTEYDKKNLSKNDQKKIQQATAKWEAANAKGDTKGMKEAADAAAAIRNNAGYKTDSSGNYTGAYTGGSSKGGNSQYTGVSNNQYVGKGTYNDARLPAGAKNQIEIYKTLYNNAMASGDTDTANAVHAAAQAIRKEYGYSGGDDGSEYIELGGFGADDILNWEYDEVRPTAPTRDPRIDAMLDEILNRDDFSYDVTNDPLYKQYSEMYQREGDRATRNTLAEAAAGAGGMNSYAITAAQQANNYYNSQLNDVIPQLYEAAYQKYLTGIDNKVRDLGLLNEMDATQYNRYRDTMSDWYKDKSFAYGKYQDAVNQNNWRTNFDYTDEWKNKEWDANQAEIQYNKDTYNQEKAYNQIMEWIKEGITTFDPALIAEAGLTQAEVDRLIAARKAEMGGISTPSYNGVRNNPTYTPTVDEPQETNNPSWVAGLDDLGLGYIYDPELLVDLEEAGAIKAVNGKLVWADGWNAQNFRQKLIEKPKNPFFNSITTLF